MVSPWKGPRHQSWASNSVLAGIALFVILVATVIVDQLNGPSEPPPTYLTGLLGLAGGAFFGAVGSDKSKREADTAHDAATTKNRMLSLNEDIIRTEAKTDNLGRITKANHPDQADQIDPPMVPDEIRDRGKKGKHGKPDEPDEQGKQGGAR